MFTSKQIREIASRLATLAVKDSQFEPASKISSDDYIAIIQDGVNKRATIGQFVSEMPTAFALGNLTDVTLTSPAQGNILMYDGSGWVNAAFSAGSLYGLQEVKSTTSPTSNDLFYFDGYQWTNKSISGLGLATTSDLNDYQQKTPALTSILALTGEGYLFRSAAGVWSLRTIEGGGGEGVTSLYALTEVNSSIPSTVAEGDLLYYHNGLWTNSTAQNLGLVTTATLAAALEPYQPKTAVLTQLLSGLTSTGASTLLALSTITSGTGYAKRNANGSWTLDNPGGGGDEPTPSGGAEWLKELSDVNPSLSPSEGDLFYYRNIGNNVYAWTSVPLSSLITRSYITGLIGDGTYQPLSSILSSISSLGNGTGILAKTDANTISLIPQLFDVVSYGNNKYYVKLKSAYDGFVSDGFISAYGLSAGSSAGATELTGLSDVVNTFTNLQSGDVLYYNGTKWTNMYVGDIGAGGSIPASISQLASLSGSGLVYKNGDTFSLQSIPTTLGGLTDVSLANETLGDVLYYNGSGWVNNSFATLAAAASYFEEYTLPNGQKAIKLKAAYQGIISDGFISAYGLSGTSATDGAISLYDLAEVNINPSSGTPSVPAADDILCFDGTSRRWTNKSISQLGIGASSNVELTSLSWTDGTTAGPTLGISQGNTLHLEADIPVASVTVSGAVNTIAQSFSGEKTFTNGATVNGVLTIPYANNTSAKIKIGNASGIEGTDYATIEWDNQNQAIKINGSIYATKAVSAYGIS